MTASSPAPTNIRVSFRTIDRYSESRTFSTLAGARKYAHAKIGETPDIGSGYAVGTWGDAKIMVSGTVDARDVSLFDIFPRSAW